MNCENVRKRERMRGGGGGSPTEVYNPVWYEDDHIFRTIIRTVLYTDTITCKTFRKIRKERESRYARNKNAVASMISVDNAMIAANYLDSITMLLREINMLCIISTA